MVSPGPVSPTLPFKGDVSNCFVVSPGPVSPVLPLKGDVSSVLPKFKSAGPRFSIRSFVPNRCFALSIIFVFAGFVGETGVVARGAVPILVEILSDLSPVPAGNFPFSSLSTSPDSFPLSLP